jgi:hypothetical protein
MDAKQRQSACLDHSITRTRFRWPTSAAAPYIAARTARRNRSSRSKVAAPFANFNPIRPLGKWFEKPCAPRRVLPGRPGARKFCRTLSVPAPLQAPARRKTTTSTSQSSLWESAPPRGHTTFSQSFRASGQDGFRTHLKARRFSESRPLFPCRHRETENLRHRLPGSHPV